MCSAPSPANQHDVSPSPKSIKRRKEKKKLGSTSETIFKMLVRGTSICFPRRYEKCSEFLGNGERSGRGKSSGGNFAANFASDVSIPRQLANPNDLKIVAVARANATRYQAADGALPDGLASSPGGACSAASPAACAASCSAGNASLAALPGRVPGKEANE